MLEQLFAGIVIALVVAVPGVLLAFAALGGTKLGRFEKALVGVILGLLVVPALEILEFVLLGIKMSAGLVLVNAIVVAGISLFLLYSQSRLKMPEWATGVTEARLRGILNKNVILIILVALMATGFYVRFATA